jgi:hypothetical protein
MAHTGKLYPYENRLRLFACDMIYPNLWPTQLYISTFHIFHGTGPFPSVSDYNAMPWTLTDAVCPNPAYLQRHKYIPGGIFLFAMWPSVSSGQVYANVQMWKGTVPQLVCTPRPLRYMAAPFIVFQLGIDYVPAAGVLAWPDEISMAIYTWAHGPPKPPKSLGMA